MRRLISPTASATTPSRYFPGLDGLRAYAVMAVVLFHCGVAGFDGGWIGVDVFFGLSGFLITGLLVGEIDGRGSIGLSRFWARRFRRLVPALVALLTTVVVLAALVDLAVRSSGVWGAVTYTTNWVHILVPGNSYWSLYAEPDPLNHLWSLAIEEQFYLLWPLVVLVVGRRWGRSWVGRTAVVLAVVSVGVQVAGSVAGWSVDRLYQGTDTRAFPFLLGGALACVGVPAWWHGDGRVARRAALCGVGAATAVLVAATVWLDGSHRSIFHGPLQAVSIAGVVLVAEATRSRSWLLCHPAIRTIGAWSYGIYLFHWPLVIVFDDQPTAVRTVLVVVLSTLLAALSYRLVEMPVRTQKVDGWRLAPGIAGALAVTLAAFAVATPIVPSAMADGDGTAIYDAAPPVTAPPASAATTVPPDDPGDAGSDAPGSVPSSLAPTTAPPPPLVAVVGDSVPALAAPQIVEEAQARGWRLRMVARQGCVPSPHVADQFDKEGCQPLLQSLPDRVRDADAVVLWFGGTGAEFKWDGDLVAACGQPDGTVALANRASWFKDVVGSIPTTVVLPVPRSDVGAKDAAGTLCEDEAYTLAAEANGWTTVSLADVVCPDPPGDCDRLNRPDGLHYDPEAAAVVARIVLDGAAQTLAAASAAGASPGDPAGSDGPVSGIPTTVPQPTSPPSTATASSTAAPSAATPSTSAAPRPLLDDVDSILVMGDSTAQVLSDGLTSTGRFSVTDAGVWGCPLVPATQVREREDASRSTTYCPTPDQQLGVIQMVGPDVVVVMTASPEQWDLQLPGLDGWHSPGSPAWLRAHDAEIDLLATTFPDTVFLLADMPEARPPAEDSLESAERVAVWNREIERWADAYGNVVVLPYARYITSPDDPADEALRPDGVHLTDDAVNRLAEEHLADDIVAAARTAHG